MRLQVLFTSLVTKPIKLLGLLSYTCFRLMKAFVELFAITHYELQKISR